ncbi:hypothetical protein RhiLY_10609 [Ceratobasidium sp. AG-Ba]|nr:hypothetical protein RhiLY_10609 [Ceratobasidium sp. AG-Ba]
MSVRLRNAFVNMYELASTRLTELYLDTIREWDPSLDEIGDILADSPVLRSVAIRNITMVLPEGFVPKPAVLNHLETLTIEAEDPMDLWSILLLITSTSNAIRLSLSLTEDPRCVSTAHAFFSRCRITMLHLHAKDPAESLISSLLVYMPHLRVVVLRDFTLTGETLQDSITEHSITRHSATLWPSLREMFLVKCNPTLYTLTKLGLLLRSSCTISIIDELGLEPHQTNDEIELRSNAEDELANYGVNVQFLEPADNPAVNWTFVYD